MIESSGLDQDAVNEQIKVQKSEPKKVESQPQTTERKSLTSPEPASGATFKIETAALATPEVVPNVTKVPAVLAEPKKNTTVATLAEPKKVNQTTAAMAEPKKVNQTTQAIAEPKKVNQTTQAIAEPKKVNTTTQAIAEPKKVNQTTQAIAEPKKVNQTTQAIAEPKKSNQTGPAASVNNIKPVAQAASLSVPSLPGPVSPNAAAAATSREQDKKTETAKPAAKEIHLPASLTAIAPPV